MTREHNGASPVEASESAQADQDANKADSFPPEGSVESILRPEDGDKPISESDRLKATRAVIASGVANKSPAD